MLDFHSMNKDLDTLLEGTNFEAEVGYEVKNGVFLEEINGIEILKRGLRPRKVLTTIDSQEDLELFKEFINHWRQPLLDIRDALQDEINADVGCTTDVIVDIIDKVFVEK